MTERLPDLRPASVTVFMKDGSRFHASVETNRGDWQDPYDQDQLFEKYQSLALRLWNETTCNQVARRINSIEQTIDISSIFKTPTALI